MSRVTLIQHINIQVSDREKTRKFYEDVLGAEFLDRGPEMNARQLQLRIGNGEIHTTDSRNPTPVPSVHFAVEINDWDELIENLERLGVPYTTTPGRRNETENSWGRREYSSGCYTYIHDPDGNMIELVQHPMGIEDSDGNTVDIQHYDESPQWRRHPQYNSAPVPAD